MISGYTALIESFVAGRLPADAFTARFAPMFAAEDYLTGDAYAALCALFAKVDSYAAGAKSDLTTDETALRAAAFAALARLQGDET